MSDIVNHYQALIATENLINKNDYTIYFLYKKGKVILNGVQKKDIDAYAEEFKKSLKPKVRLLDSGIGLLKTHGFVVESDFDEIGFKQAQKDRSSRIQNYWIFFKKALFNEYGVKGLKAEKLFEICEARAGTDLEEIESLFEDFVELVCFE